MSNNETTKDGMKFIISIGLSFLFFFVSYFGIEPFVPTLLYDYNETTKTIEVFHTGLNSATNVLIEIIPNNKIQINNVTTSKINGEPIIDYSKEGRIIYFMHHVNHKDIIFFQLNSEQKIDANNIAVFIRTDEGTGVKALDFFLDLQKNAQIFLFIVSTILAVSIYFTLGKSLQKYILKNP